MADNVTLPGTGAVVAADDVSGVQYQRVKLVDGTADSDAAIAGDATNGLDVDVTRMPTGASATAVQGTVAAGSAAAQNPVQMGAKAVSTLPAAVDANDVAPVQTDLYGRMLMLPYAPTADTISGCSAKIEDTNAANVIATDSGAGFKWYVTDIMVTNGDATVGTLVTIQDDEGTPTVIWQGYAAPAGGGWSHRFVVPVPTAANAHIHVICGTMSAEVYACVSAYKAV